MRADPASAPREAPLVIPLFLPHAGCPHACAFCRQQDISGHAAVRLDRRAIEQTIEEWLRRTGRRSRVQVAFYGGSFTCLPVARQREMLSAVAPYLAHGLVQGIRLSTRPDCVEPRGLAMLAGHGVRVVELGVQSLDDKVLARIRRGHTARDVWKAVEQIRETGMDLGLQLMLGLPGQSFSSLRATIRQVIGLRPDFLRIYPALVLEKTQLAHWYRQGTYRPLGLDQAVAQAAWVRERCERAGIRVVRIGLQAGPSLTRALVAGPWHPAFGELVAGRLLLWKGRRVLAQSAGLGSCQLELSVAERDLSLFLGQSRYNLKRLERSAPGKRIDIRPDPELPRGTLRLHVSS